MKLLPGRRAALICTSLLILPCLARAQQDQYVLTTFFGGNLSAQPGGIYSCEFEILNRTNEGNKRRSIDVRSVKASLAPAGHQALTGAAAINVTIHAGESHRVSVPIFIPNETPRGLASLTCVIDTSEGTQRGFLGDVDVGGTGTGIAVNRFKEVSDIIKVGFVVAGVAAIGLLCFLKTPQKKIQEAARTKIGSSEWLYDVANGNFPAGKPKCNLFVDDMLKAAGINPPRVWGPGRSSDDFLWRIPQAREWADPNQPIANFQIITREEASAGDVVATPEHVGIVDDFDMTISADNLHGGLVTRSQFGFRDGERATFRRYAPPKIDVPQKGRESVGHNF